MISRYELTTQLKTLMDTIEGYTLFDVESALKLVRLGADPNVISDGGNTLLGIIVMKNINGRYDQVIEELVTKHKANINIQFIEDGNPLISYLKICNMSLLQIVLLLNLPTEVAMKLVRLGADPDVKAISGQSFLYILLSKNEGGRNDQAIEELITKHNANIDIQNKSGLTLLQCLINDEFPAETILKLIRLGADLNVKNADGQPLLHMLIVRNEDGRYDKVIEELVTKYKVNIDIQDDKGLTPFQYVIINYGVISNCNIKNARQLISLGANPNAKNADGKALLHVLIVKNWYGEYDQAIKELVENCKVNIDIKDAEGLTPLQNLMNYVINYNASPSFIKNVMKLINLGANPNVRNADGKTLLHRFVEQNKNGCCDQVIEELVREYKANIDIQDDKGLTPLQSAINYNTILKSNINNAIKLIRLGANPNVRNANGKALLHILIEKNWGGEYDQVIEELVKEYKANIDIQDAEGFTPLQKLMNLNERNIEAFMKLVRLGADFNVKNTNGGSFLEVIKKQNRYGRYNQIIEELKTRQSRAINNFLNILVLLACDKNNGESTSNFNKILRNEIILYIVSFLYDPQMGKTQEDCLLLADHILSHPQETRKFIKEEGPGGFNVFQDNTQGKVSFTLFRSVRTFCKQYQEYKSYLEKNEPHTYPTLNKANKLIGRELSSAASSKLDDYTKQYAMTIWNEHSSLYKKGENKQALLNEFINVEPYNYFRSKMK